ncbi:LysE family transporter [Permianibacter sp. IMCC34836]|uniref:LysE family transporter n=1 Tax=Permianibacter fluminis TaxID=2738515 RepID=UPI0015542D76|nr:LysE family transporter [Permianibacter fluminis]NQD36549.1 LysE family transporter [Permianibacter fluminis]
MSQWQAFLFGITLAIAVGPIALLIINTSLQVGVRAGLSCALGATAADLLFALLAFHAADRLVPLLQAYAQPLQGIAALVLMLLALRMLYQLRRRDGAAAPVRSHRHYVFTTFALTVVNPLTVLAFGSFALQLVTTPTAASATILAGAAAAGTGSIAVLMVLAAGALGRLFGKRGWLVTLNALSALGILAFGVRGLWLAA